MVKLNCIACKVYYYRTRSQYARRGSKYCSRQCQNRTQAAQQATIKHSRAIERMLVATQPDDYRIIKAAGKHTVMVDIEDYDLATEYAWHLHSQGYADCRSTEGHFFLHRMIAERICGRPLQSGEVVDHANHVKLDNRRANLRVTTQSNNCANMVLPAHNTSGYKGVHWKAARNCWHATIKHKGKIIYIGAYTDKADAAYGYDQFAMQLFGRFAKTNFEYR